MRVSQWIAMRHASRLTSCTCWRRAQQISAAACLAHINTHIRVAHTLTQHEHRHTGKMIAEKTTNAKPSSNKYQICIFVFMDMLVWWHSVSENAHHSSSLRYYIQCRRKARSLHFESTRRTRAERVQGSCNIIMTS